ncbi:DNA polymerase epsilon catalytic subunit [Entophlyctis luteolus]|nr:DNA polymerase epsilon catalytic subunit [Entophlyctis luteolus]
MRRKDGPRLSAQRLRGAGQQQPAASGGSAFGSFSNGKENKENDRPDYDSRADVSLKFARVARQDEIDSIMGFTRYSEGPARLGWMVNMLFKSLATHNESPNGHSAIECYFLEEDGGSFKVTVLFEPYLYLVCKAGSEPDVEEYLHRLFGDLLSSISRDHKEDLSMPNHLSGKLRTVVKLKFHNMQNLSTVRSALYPIIASNKAKLAAESAYEGISEFGQDRDSDKYTKKSSVRDAADNLLDMREYDLMFYVRAAIDCDFRVGLWYDVRASGLGKISIEERRDKVKRAEPVVFAFDIETTKLPLKFPDAAIDNIMMISYMIDGQGFLITNRSVVSEDIHDFEYSPKPEFEGPFSIFNEPDERSVLQRFFNHIRQAKPTVFVTYNGDFFDWPFIEARATVHGFSLEKEIGFWKDSQDEYKAAHAIHMDAFCWVKRDSYLPQGSQGLKAVTTYKLGYNPTELDPEDMTRFAREQPQTLAQYSVSDAVATYYLYMKYVHPFIFSLCNIIPMNPDDVLRRGSGTLCETLLMVEAYKANVLMPNKHQEVIGKMFDGHLLESETYVGGHVEALEAGVFRSDLETQFRLVPSAYQKLIDEIDQALEFSIVVEHNLKMDDVMNLDEVRSSIISRLSNLRDEPNKLRLPLIYHLDVAAMYPNIILTNRLQPDAMVTDNDCIACDFNQGASSSCQRKMVWSWRGEYYPAKRSEYNMIRNQIERELFPNPVPGGPPRSFHDLKPHEQHQHIKKRVEDYSKKIYAKKFEHKVVDKESIVCQRENPFYVNTVRNFRDRRYTYKGLLKTWKKKVDEAVGEGDIMAAAEAKKMTVVYDSLQLAHKCILNSFYGYVMRKGARWYSMEMAGIVCLTGAKIIQLARSRVEDLGRPLELDTDGIWLILPSTFPENFEFKLRNGKSAYISYPCIMLNHLVHAEFTNHQYQDLKDPTAPVRQYVTKSENSIFFEVDGPYRAMILPSSLEEDKLLKKRYAVFNDDGSLAELKGFEVKRRGELKLIKIFQTAIFKVFLEGGTLSECYAAVAAVCNQWLDVLYSKGADMEDHELFELISENRSMSKSLEDYGAQKSTSISTAKRLAEFLGDAMVKDKGLACKFIISQKPVGLPVSERAIPVSIFQAEESVKRHFLRKWLKDSNLIDVDIRHILDWSYYLERFGSVIQKLVTIPAAMQGISNPVLRVRHPDWLQKRVSTLEDKFKQKKITDIFLAAPVHEDMDDTMEFPSSGKRSIPLIEMEDMVQDLSRDRTSTNGIVATVRKRMKTNSVQATVVEEIIEIPDELPDPSCNYGAWLKIQKLKWKKMRIQKSQDWRMDSTSTRWNRMNTTTTTHGFFQQQTMSVLRESWQIIQIVETDIAGEFNVWALIGDAMYTVKLQIPRIIYVNSRASQSENYSIAKNGFSMQRRQKALPRSHTTLNLYELRMRESFYKENTEVFARMFSHHEIEGVYETQIPLLFRALMNIGCSARVTDTRINSGRGLEAGFELDDLKHTSSSVVPYLKDSKVKILYLYHAGKGSKHIYGLFSSATNKSIVFIVDPARNRSAVPNLSRIYAERRQEKREKDLDMPPTQYLASSQSQPSSKPSPPETVAFEYPEDIETSFSVHGTDSEALSAINQAVFENQNSRYGPTILILQSPKRSNEWKSSGFRLVDDFPRVSVPSHKKDSAFPPLSWQTQAAKRMMSHFLNLNSFLHERIELSRFADIPIGNIENDYPLFLTDVFFARRLTKSDMVLWYSPSERPDLGGREQDDNQLETDELRNFEMNHPGTYGNVCVEISVFNLAFNTVLQSSYVNEIEGVSDVDGLSLGNNSFVDDQFRNVGNEQSNTNENQGIASLLNTSDEEIVSHKTLRILREMVQSWQYQFESRQDKLAEMMLEHFYRWLTSASSCVHDPAIINMIHRLMRKVFLQLVSEFKQLGSEVVFCNFEKLILATCKTSMKNAVHYTKYIIETICKKPVFQHIDIAATQFWEHVIWMDRHNYAGIVCVNPEKFLETDLLLEAVDGENISIEMHWNIMDYLPPMLHKEFEQMVGYFIFEVHREKSARRSISLKGEANPSNQGNITDMTIFLQQLVGQHIKRKLFESISKIPRRVHPNDPEDHKFPDLPGSHLELHNPALEFIKTVVAVFELDKAIERDVRVLKRDLLALLQIKEFSKEAIFVNPCEPFRMSQVICEYCNLARDMDLTCDRDLLPQIKRHDTTDEEEDSNAASIGDDDDDDDEEQESEEEMEVGSDKEDRRSNREITRKVRQSENSNDPQWICRGCGTEYDQLSIEQKIVDLVSRKLMVWQMQDLKCKLCKNIRARNIDRECECSGEYITTLSRAECLRKLKVVANIARFYKMEMLQDVVGWVNEIV